MGQVLAMTDWPEKGNWMEITNFREIANGTIGADFWRIGEDRDGVRWAVQLDEETVLNEARDPEAYHAVWNQLVRWK